VELEAALFGAEPATREPERAAPGFAAIHQQRQTQRFVTLQLLWEEYRAANPDGYRYSRFCELYQRWRQRQDVVLRQEYKAGEKLFVDWAGPTIPIYSRMGTASKNPGSFSSRSSRGSGLGGASSAAMNCAALRPKLRRSAGVSSALARALSRTKFARRTMRRRGSL
jgi:hypothetical protein